MEICLFNIRFKLKKKEKIFTISKICLQTTFSGLAIISFESIFLLQLLQQVKLFGKEFGRLTVSHGPPPEQLPSNWQSSLRFSHVVHVVCQYARNVSGGKLKRSLLSFSVTVFPGIFFAPGTPPARGTLGGPEAWGPC